MSYQDIFLHRLPNLLRQIRKIKRHNVPKFYAVAVGRRKGIYRTWGSCKVQIDGIANAKYARFETEKEALKFLANNPQETLIPIQDYNTPPGKLREGIVYTDGSCWRNGFPDARAGIGVYWPGMEERNVSELIDGRQTCIRAEVRAAITALNQAKEMNIDVLTVYTDSHFVISTATQWLWIWNNNGWLTTSRHEIKNKEDMIEFDLAIKQLRKVIWKPVPSHTGIYGNEEADRLANLAIERELGSKGKRKKKKTTEEDDEPIIEI